MVDPDTIKHVVVPDTINQVVDPDTIDQVVDPDTIDQVVDSIRINQLGGERNFASRCTVFYLLIKCLFPGKEP